MLKFYFCFFLIVGCSCGFYDIETLMNNYMNGKKNLGMVSIHNKPKNIFQTKNYPLNWHHALRQIHNFVSKLFLRLRLFKLISRKDPTTLHCRSVNEQIIKQASMREKCYPALDGMLILFHIIFYDQQ